MLKIIINGAQGKMGQEAVKAVQQDAELELVASLGRGDDLAQHIQTKQADIVVDLTTPQAVYTNCETIITANACPVIGTTGLSIAQIEALQQQCHEKKLGGLIAPNFSIGAILMMRFAAQAAHYLKHVEIIEMHHAAKKDAPSGTALKTAEMVADQSEQALNATVVKNTNPARGLESHHVPIHSVRLPGLVAHQQVIFGNIGETLTLRHDTSHRQAFMPGVLLACKKVKTLDHLVYGLEQLLD